MKILTFIDLAKNEIRNAIMQNLASAPSSPLRGSYYFDTTDGKMKIFDGTDWKPVGDSAIETIKLGSTTLVISNKTVTIPVDSTPTEGSSNLLLSGAVWNEIFGTDGLDGRIETLEGQIGGLAGAMHFLGFVESVPTSATVVVDGETVTAEKGDVVIYGYKEYIFNGTQWKELGDENIYAVKGAIVNSDIAANAAIDQSKISGLSAALSAINTALDTLNGDASTEGSVAHTVAQALGGQKYTSTITGNGTTTSFNVSHNLGSKDVVVEIYEAASPYQKVLVDVEHTSTSAVAIVFGTAPAQGTAYNVVVKL